MNTAQPSDAWRVAALSMMSQAELRALFTSDPAVAAPWVIAAAGCGLTEAQIRLGRMHLSGKGVARDAEAAFGQFASAAAKDDIEGHNMLGRCHDEGWGTAVDKTRAATHYRRAADAGHAWAQYNLGHLLLDGDGLPQDREEAFRYYALAAAQDHVRAMNLVGRCYEEGWGVARDTAMSRHWYCLSAKGGYFCGAYNYATILAAYGCINGALWWFKAALKDAPVATRYNIVKALSHSARDEFRALAGEFLADHALPSI